MAITIEEAKRLRYGDMLHHWVKKNADGTPVRLKVNGQPKVWKTRPDCVKVPLKHGMYEYGYLISDDTSTLGIPHTSFVLLLQDVNLGDGLE